VAPEGGYPAEFGFTFAQQTIFLYASVVHSGSGYHLRVTTPGIPSVLETSYAAITFFGEPGKLNGNKSETAFLTNPTDCPAGPLSSRIELEPWGNPGHPQSKEATVYPGMTGCGLLRFNPSLAMAPSTAPEGGTAQADTPSAYTTDLTVPQTSRFSELATPELKDATVTLPEGVSVSPSAGQGLAGCQATGPEGINIGSSQIGPGGRDEGDPRERQPLRRRLLPHRQRALPASIDPRHCRSLHTAVANEVWRGRPAWVQTWGIGGAVAGPCVPGATWVFAVQRCAG
jgi:hypothetical protein